MRTSANRHVEGLELEGESRKGVSENVVKLAGKMVAVDEQLGTSLLNVSPLPLDREQHGLGGTLL